MKKIWVALLKQGGYHFYTGVNLIKFGKNTCSTKLKLPRVASLGGGVAQTGKAQMGKAQTGQKSELSLNHKSKTHGLGPGKAFNPLSDKARYIIANYVTPDSRLNRGIPAHKSANFPINRARDIRARKKVFRV